VVRRLVEEKHVLAIDEPLSTRPGKPALYRVADSNLRFYLAVGRAAHNLSKRGRSKAAATLIRGRWATWRGRAVEPIIRDALSRAAPELPWPEPDIVGGWWNRAFDPEVDLIGADRAPVARALFYAGSVKWLDRPFGDHDLAELRRGAASASGFSDAAADGLALTWRPADVVAAFTGTRSLTQVDDVAGRDRGR
jgi:hypothetical protein